MLPLKVLIVDDHRLFRQGLMSIMITHPELVTVVGEAASGQEALNLIPSLQPDVILLDIYMPEMDGLQAARLIHAAHPQVAIIMLTSSEVDKHLLEAIRLGASGYLLKNLDANELFDLLGGVARGEAALTRSMASRLAQSVANQPTQALVELTERELDILKLIARGASNNQIAAELFIAVNTVKYHLKNILAKLELENRTQAAAYALQHGIVLPDEADSDG
jgi:DNA-binding NarL/FixJ family response regulator